MELVTASYLELLFDISAKHIQEINNYTRINRREKSFPVYKPLDQDLVLIIPSSFKEGDESKVVPELIFGYEYPEDSLSYPITFVHSHNDGLSISSKRDLRVLSVYRKVLRNEYSIDVKIIEAIVSPLSEKDHTLLLVQEKTQNPISRRKIDSIYNKIIDLMQHAEEKEISIGENKYMHIPIAELYESTGFYNALEVVFNEETGLRIPKKDLEKFAFDMDVSNLRLE